MSQRKRHDLREGGIPLTDETRTFKKHSQTVNRSHVTDHNINDDYLRDPPLNASLPSEAAVNLPSRRAKEVAREDIDSKEEGILGDEPVGKQLRSDALEELVSENTVHGNTSGVQEIS
ncbi:hypothetical protein ABKN59_007528 [Abortiporus biennis]